MKKSLLIIIFSITILSLSLNGCSNDEIIKNTSEEVSTPDIKTINNIDQWEHPTKESFGKLDYWFGELSKVELYQEETYPIFYLDIKYWTNFLENLDAYNFEDLITQISQANGYWDYEIRDTDNRLWIKVTCDKEEKIVKEYKINEYKDIKDFLLTVRDKEFNEFLSKLSEDELNNLIECKGDVDGDGSVEGIIVFNEDLYLVSYNEGQSCRNLGKLIDNYSVGHDYTGYDIRKLDKSNKEYIVINVCHDVTFAEGYFIYDYDGYQPEVIFIDFPGATAYGTRLLFDYDNDGIEDHVRYDDYIDIQQHRVISYRSFTGGKDEKELHYRNEKGEFFYPESPEDVVQSYIDASRLVSKANFERDRFLTRPELKNIKLDYTPNTITYMEIALDIKLVEEDESQIILDVTQEPFYGDVINMRFYLIRSNDVWKIDNIETVGK